jgi:tRNA nucleotidyltransferase (CCA-adding enzyme)
MRNNFSIPKEVLDIIHKLEEEGFEAYVVGGSLRDLMLGKAPGDWDVTTNAVPEEIQALFPDSFYENTFGTVGVKTESEDSTLKVVEVTPYRLESKYSDNRHPDQVTFSQNIEDDLTRRDFTVNAMAYNPSTHELLDFYDGQKDLDKKLIRAVGEAETRFQEDALRMMRAVRFSSQLGFAIESETFEAITQNKDLLKNISWERIHDEFVKIIMSPGAVQGIDMLQKTGLLTHIIPELEEGIGCKQNGNHIYDVYEHLLRALAHGVEESHSLELRIAALFHDIGKPRTREWSKEKQDYTFYAHEVVGAKMVREIMKRMKFSKEVGQKIVTLVRYHMFFSDPDAITLSAVRRLLARVGEETLWQLIELRKSDRIGMGRPSAEPYRLRKFESMIREVTRDPINVGMLKIDGKKLMEMGERPSPRIGYILFALLEEVLEKPEKNTEEYLEARVIALQMIPDAELRELGEKGKRATQEADEAEVKEIQKEFKVKQVGRSE